MSVSAAEEHGIPLRMMSGPNEAEHGTRALRKWSDLALPMDCRK